jgi:hypothetical protein
MILFKLSLENIFKFFAFLYSFIAGLIISLTVYLREKHIIKDLKSIDIDGIKFKKKTVLIEGYEHQYTLCGSLSAKSNETLIMMGGIPSDPSESMFWMAAEIIKMNSSFKILILHLPFYENYSKIELKDDTAKFNTLNLPFNRESSNENVKVDPKFSHYNQSKVVEKILKKLEIFQAHFIGHDRGVIVFEHLMIRNKDLFLSLSRGAQVWDYYEDEWSELAPSICVGPPHRFMTKPWQLKLLFNLITFFEFPFAIRSEGFLNKCKDAKKGSELFNRFTHLTFRTNMLSKNFLLKFKQTMYQTDSFLEINNRKRLPDNIKIMQFQGEDEFKLNSKNKLISDQPYFGKYNLFKNEIEDIYPNCEYQVPNKIQNQFIDSKNDYKKVTLLPTARMSFFALIPDSAHFNVIENPKGCASAVNDFISECNLEKI